MILTFVHNLQQCNNSSMLRSRGINSRINDPKVSTKSSLIHPKRSTTSLLSLFSMLVTFMLGMTVQSYMNGITSTSLQSPPSVILSQQIPTSLSLSSAFDGMIRRAQTQQRHCTALGLTENQVKTFKGLNDHDAHLSQFGLLEFLKKDYRDDGSYPHLCELPPEQECEETQFTVIFMAYNPDRLQKMYNQILKMNTDFQGLVKEVVVVWNGERKVEETKMGQALVDLTKVQPVRISYPLQAGFPNDLFNRYHPRLAITTKAIMYYDDDGPFYSYKATLGGFELWKRNSNAQIGAMARKIDFTPRQEEERLNILNGPGDRFFISHCPTDEVNYNFNEFAQFGAKMVLPSGSFLHSNYLACLWHPIFQELRQYVQHHPVNPDDGTVSAIVAQLSGRAPKVYSRRINESEGGGRRRLLEAVEKMEVSNMTTSPLWDQMGKRSSLPIERRRLMDGINWDAGGDHQKKHDWGKLRSDAANSLMRYFGSINSGSIGWCYGTPFQEGEYCKPDQARVGQLPWLKPDHTAKDSCP